MEALMVENDLLTEQELNAGGIIANESIPDPRPCVDNAISNIHDALRRLELTFGVDWQDFEIFLCSMEPDLDLTIDELWRRVDCEVYAQYLNGELTRDYYVRWYKDLSHWQKAMIEATQRFKQWKRMYLIDRSEQVTDSYFEEKYESHLMKNFEKTLQEELS